ncbi:MAG TPA: MopE-related protein, partial [Polyangium sp.]|nr:MopE-related protein [Polyangium sp.]
ARFTNPPVQLDESSRAPIPIQMAGLVAIEVEKVTGESAIPLTLIQSDDAMMHVTMLVDGIVDETIGLMGFAQDHFSGRWQRGTRNEKFLGSAVPGKKMKWAADVLHLGMLAPGLAFGATKVEKYKVVANGMSSARDRGVLVRALGTRSASMGFTDQNGEVTLVVPNSGDTKVMLPSLDGTGAKALPPDLGNEIQVNVPMSSACSIAGEKKTASNGVGASFCNGFVWGDESVQPLLPPQPEGIGWRCGTDQPGICALGRTTMGGGCEPIIKAMPEMCNGLDDDCDGQVDEEPETMAGIGVDCIADAMTNHLGKTACNAFGAIVCMPNDVPPPDPPECTPGETRFCDYDGPPEKAGIGTCQPGVKKCDAAGKWGPCSESVLPNTQEECDGLDDDCDGTVDEGCACLPEQTEPCYSGPMGTQNVGPCSAGTKTCDMIGQWGVCLDEVLPGSEACNGLDDDCNGTVDNGIAPLNCGVGACAVTAPGCVNGTPGTCTPGQPNTETCNGIDDDCNGTVDNGIAPLNCGVGACAVTAPGCVNGMPGTCTPGQPNTETCNGIDDDCDGTVDNGIAPLNCGVGACAVTAPGCVN